MSEMMKAVRIHEFGGPEVLLYEDAPKPVVSAEHVLIKVCAAGVNPVDWKVRAGHMSSVWHMPLPFIMGWDIAGVVEEVGEGVDDLKPGDAVYTDSSTQGGYAEYAVVKAKEIALKPTSLTFAEAASLPVAALTAWQGLFDHGNLQPGQTVLVHAASGGVGLFAVQFAKWKGATVIGTASAQNEEFVRSLGVDQFIDYRSEKFEEVITEKIDLVYDAVGQETATRSLPILKPGGRLIAIAGSPAQQERAKYDVHVEAFFSKQGHKDLDSIASLIDAGAVKTYVSTILPLSEARTAHEQIETGRTRGKIVLQVTAE